MHARVWGHIMSMRFFNTAGTIIFWVGFRFAGHREFSKGRIELWQPYNKVADGLISHDTVTAVSAAGIMPYYLSGLTVIDLHGLNDKTITRNPVTLPNNQRRIAHDRTPPPGYLEKRGVNFIPYPAATSAAEAHRIAPYAVPVGPNLRLPFDTNNPQWAEESFATFSHIERWRIDTVPAVIVSTGTPVVGERFTVRLSDATRRAGFIQRAQWQWERGSDAEGWRLAIDGCGASYQYVPSADEVGLRLRAYTYYTDAEGNRIKAITPASAPVAAK